MNKRRLHTILQQQKPRAMNDINLERWLRQGRSQTHVRKMLRQWDPIVQGSVGRMYSAVRKNVRKHERTVKNLETNRKKKISEIKRKRKNISRLQSEVKKDLNNLHKLNKNVTERNLYIKRMKRNLKQSKTTR